MPERTFPKPKWYRLDASGYMYPMIKTRDTQSIFALAARLDEDIVPEVLDEAVNNALTRYPYFKVRLKHGLFRYYFKDNKNEFRSKEDSGRILEAINFSENRGYPFRISYYKRTVRLEIFHAVTDGRGASEFLKTVIFEYIRLKYGENPAPENVKAVGTPVSSEEYEDAYQKYSKGCSVARAAKIVPEAAVPVKDKQLKFMGFGITTAVADAAVLKEKARAYGCSVTEYLTAVILLAVYETHSAKGNKRKITGFIPVDLRKAFPSETMRNFVTFAFAKINPAETEPTVEAYVAAVKRDLRAFLKDGEILAEKLSVTTLMSKQPVVRFLPQAVKNAIVRSVRAFGGYSQSMIVSNLGELKFSPDAAKHVEEFYFYLNCNGRSPKNAAAVTFGGKCYLSFSRRTVGEKVEARTFELLEADGVSLSVFSNGRTEEGRYAADEERFKVPSEKGRKYLNISDLFLAAAVIISIPVLAIGSVIAGSAGLIFRTVTRKKVGFLDM